MISALRVAYRYRAVAYSVAAFVLIGNLIASKFPLSDDVRRILTSIALGALVLMGIVISSIWWGPRVLPAQATRVVQSPVRGRWLAMNSPETKVPSHGVRMYGQSHAIDLVEEPLIEGGRTRPTFGTGGSFRPAADYPAFGAPVFAMVSGTVVQASHWRRDHRARSTLGAVLFMIVEGAVREIGGAGFILGNHVTIRGEDGVYATVAHLQQGSVTVAVGETVTAGQQIARCGNSGNSSEPHVHAQLMDRAHVYIAQGIPLAFAGVRIGDQPGPLDGLPANGEHVTITAEY